MKKKFFLIWVIVFAILIAFDILVYWGIEDIECMEPSIGLTVVINVALSTIVAIIFALIIDTYSSNKMMCRTIIIAQSISLIALFVWLFYLNIILLVLISIIILAVAVVEIIHKNIRLAVACLFWLMVLFCLMCYIPRMGYWSV